MQWVRVFLAASLIIMVLNIVGIITNIIGIITVVGINVINMYCTFFSMLAFSAELRQFNFFRRFVSKWLSLFIFLVFYRSRGVFYIMFGLLLIGNAVLNTIAGFMAVVLGIAMIVLSFTADLPVYEDALTAQQAYDEKVAGYESEQPKKTAKKPAEQRDVSFEDVVQAHREQLGPSAAQSEGAGNAWVPPTLEEPSDSPRNSRSRRSGSAAAAGASGGGSQGFHLGAADFEAKSDSSSEDDNNEHYDNHGIIGPSAFGSRSMDN